MSKFEVKKDLGQALRKILAKFLNVCRRSLTAKITFTKKEWIRNTLTKSGLATIKKNFGARCFILP